MMKATAFILLFIVAGVAIPAAQRRPEPITWSDYTKDVYVNGELDRAAQVLTSEATQRLALVSAKLDRAVILDLAGSTVSTTSKEAFRFAADRASAESDASCVAQPAGSYTLANDSDYGFLIDGSPVRITAHEGVTGELDKPKIFETVPVWRFLMESYRPDSAVVAALNACQAETTITVALATWCPDSKQHVPRLLKALDAAENNHLHIKLIAIGRKFREPAETISQHKIVHVPTVIVERDGIEIRRIVENPIGKTMEEDLAAILNGAADTRKHE
jgi:thiol-disulfide isomerase/thioredoxin